MRRGRHLAVGFAALAVGLASCGGDDDASGGKGDGEAIPLVTTSGGPPPTSAAPDLATSPTSPTTPPSGDTPERGDDAPLPTTPADAPSPAGATPDPASKAGDRPHDLPGRIQADTTAMLNVRTMVSIIEGCHSGRDTYKSCNSHDELGDPSLLGLTIGKKRGEVQISATDNGFRITGHSMSGAKFTIARGPKGDRFKCIQGRKPGACPPDRTWSF